jgi:erythromycin esterase-like protein
MSWISDLIEHFGNGKKQLEKAKQQLVFDLETKGIRHLLHQMNNNQVYDELILEKQRKGNYSSADSVSWYAYQHSYTLHLASDKTELLQLLHDPAFADQKKNIYGCLACLCDNTSDKELFNFLMAELRKNKDENIQVVVFSRLRNIKKDESFDIVPIKTALKEGTIDVMRAAIRALANCTAAGVEDLLIDEFKYADRHLKASIANSLATTGTNKCIPFLQQAYKSTRDGALRGSIDYAMEKIAERNRASSFIAI